MSGHYREGGLSSGVAIKRGSTVVRSMGSDKGLSISRW